MNTEQSSSLLKSTIDTQKLAIEIAQNLKSYNVLALYGDLGTGKTLICREIIKFFAKKDIHVPSPTFNLMLVYETEHKPIYHYDLYRVQCPTELYELGINEAISEGICLIEWPQIAETMLPQKNTINLYLTYTNTNMRTYRIYYG